MTYALKTKTAVEQLSGNPTLTSLDGTERAPLLAVITLGRERMAEYGVYEIERADYDMETKRVVTRELEATETGVREALILEDRPPPVERTPAEKLADMGLTPAELVAIIDAERAR